MVIITEDIADWISRAAVSAKNIKKKTFFQKMKRIIQKSIEEAFFIER